METFESRWQQGYVELIPGAANGMAACGMWSARERSEGRETCCVVLSAICSARLVPFALEALMMSCIVTYRSKATQRLLMRFAA